MSEQQNQEQDRLDREDAQLRLDRLADALITEVAALEIVRNARAALKRAESCLKTAEDRVRELAFLERRRRRTERGGTV